MIVPTHLQDSLRAGMVVPFVGAGVSRGACHLFPTWPGLLDALLVECKASSRFTTATGRNFDKLRAAGEFEELAEGLKSLIPIGQYQVFLERVFDLDARTMDFANHREILKINAKVIVTTNFDRLVEHSIAKATGRTPEVHSHEQSDLLLRKIRRPKPVRPPLVYKLHGDISDINSIVLTRSDFTRLLHNSPHVASVLDALIATTTFVFLGYSVKDRDLLYHLEKYQSALKGAAYPHYMLTDLTGHAVNRDSFRDQYGVEIIEFNIGATGSGFRTAIKSIAAFCSHI